MRPLKMKFGRGTQSVGSKKEGEILVRTGLVVSGFCELVE